MVNALLGQRYLAEGILPTTNEINILKHLDPEHVEGAAQVCPCLFVGGTFGGNRLESSEPTWLGRRLCQPLCASPDASRATGKLAGGWHVWRGGPSTPPRLHASMPSCLAMRRTVMACSPASCRLSC